jgi:hypothetical protein
VVDAVLCAANLMNFIVASFILNGLKAIAALLQIRDKTTHSVGSLWEGYELRL